MKSTITNPLVLVGLAALAAVLTTNLALASPVDDQNQGVTVRYSGLDLSSPQGALELYKRIRYAAREACGFSEPRELARLEHFQECVDHAITQAVEKVKSPRVTEIHEAQTQRLPRG
jgi:UrcA family protein